MLGIGMSAFAPNDTKEIKKSSTEIMASYQISQAEYQDYINGVKTFEQIKVGKQNLRATKEGVKTLLSYGINLNKAVCSLGSCCPFYKPHQSCYVCFNSGGSAVIATEVCTTCVGCGVS